MFNSTFHPPEFTSLQLGLPLHHSRNCFASSDRQGLAASCLRRLAHVQVAASLLTIFFVALVPHTVSYAAYVSEFPRLLALLLVAIVTSQAFGSDSVVNALSGRHVTSIKRAVVALQAAWLCSEFASGSAFNSLLRHILPALSTDSIIACALPSLAMVLFSGCLDLVSFLRRRRPAPAASSRPSPHSNLTLLNVTEAGHSCSDYAPWTRSSLEGSSSISPISPADSYSPASSGALASGMPSPTGHCSSPDGLGKRGSYGAFASMSSSPDIYLRMHTIDDGQNVLFVHKTLTPIKTRPESQRPAPPVVQQQQQQQQQPQACKSLLRTLMNQAEAARAAKQTTKQPVVAMQPRPPVIDAGVTATITLVSTKAACPRPVINLTAEQPHLRPCPAQVS